MMGSGRRTPVSWWMRLRIWVGDGLVLVVREVGDDRVTYGEFNAGVCER